MRYLVKLSELEEKIEYLDNQLSIIDDNITYLKSIKSNIDWEGEAFESFSDYYDNYINELISIENKAYSTIRYLNKIYESFGNNYISIKQELINLSDKEI